MSSDKLLPNEIREFLFRWIDSAEQLEILLLLHGDPQWWSVKALNEHLRSSDSSVEARLQNLIAAGLVEMESDGRFRFKRESAEADQLISQLADAFRVHRPAVLQLIFSPAKRASAFAESFRIRSATKKEDDHG